MRRRLRDFTHRIQQEVRVYHLVLADRRTPRVARWLLVLAIGYLLSPLDIIPDVLPVIGHLDDLLLVPGLVYLALRMTPPEVVAEAREQVKSAG